MPKAQSGRLCGKRLVFSSSASSASSPSPRDAPSTNERLGRSTTEELKGWNRLEALTNDILVEVVCKVNYTDLKQLLLVSKTLNEATLQASEVHFFSTPISKTVKVVTPNAPKQPRVAKTMLDRLNPSSIAIPLFASDDER